MHEESDYTKNVINKLHISNFRNLLAIDFETNGKSVIISGENGAGKTNIIEAISLFSTKRGLRNIDPKNFTLDPNNLKIDASNMYSRDWFINVDVGKVGDDAYKFKSLLIAKVHIGQKSSYKIDGNYIKSRNDFQNLLQVIWLVPTMNSLFIGPKGDRRNFLDNIVTSYDINHNTRLLDYDRLLKDRLKLLTNAYHENKIYDRHWLEILEKKIVQTGISILCARHHIVDLLNHEGVEHEDFTNFILQLESKYDQLFLKGVKIDEVEEVFLKDLSDSREKDAIVNRSFVGVHRTDIITINRLNGMNACNCSTGEQKLLLVSLVIAQIKVCNKLRNSSAIVLLDDIVSYLDHKVRHKLLVELKRLRCQFWITGVDLSHMQAIESECLILQVENGQLSKIS